MSLRTGLLSAALSLAVLGVPAPFAAAASISTATEIDPVGGLGAPSWFQTCGGLATGFYGSAYTRVDALGLTCGSAPKTRLAGTLGGIDQRFELTCGSGSYLTGAWGYVKGGNVIAEIGPLCRPANNLNATSSWGSTAGVNDGQPSTKLFTRECPAGQAVRTMRGRAGLKFGQLILTCTIIPSPAYGTMGFVEDNTNLSPPGRTGTIANDPAHQFGEHCQPGLVMTSLSGHSGDLVDQLGATCTSVKRSPMTGIVSLGTVLSVVPAHGGPLGTPFTDSCPAGQALVGLEAMSGSLLNKVRGTCASVNAWVNTPASAIFTSTPWHGKTPAVPFLDTLTCPQGQFLSGWEIHEGSFEFIGTPVGAVSYIQPRCQGVPIG